MNIPLRVATFWLAYGAIFIGLGLVLGLVPPALRMLVAGLVVTAATVALTVRFTRSEGLTLAAAGADWTKGSVTRFVVGFAFGAAMVALQIGLTRLALGPLTFVRNWATDTSLVLLMTVTFIGLSAGEELGFRGYPFHRLRERYGIIAAQILVALVFAVYHVLQGWPLVDALVGTTAGSMLFGVAVLASRGLAFPIGVHAAWNAGSSLMGMKDLPWLASRCEDRGHGRRRATYRCRAGTARRLQTGKYRHHVVAGVLFGGLGRERPSQSAYQRSERPYHQYSTGDCRKRRRPFRHVQHVRYFRGECQRLPNRGARDRCRDDYRTIGGSRGAVVHSHPAVIALRFPSSD